MSQQKKNNNNITQRKTPREKKREKRSYKTESNKQNVNIKFFLISNYFKIKWITYST